MFSLSAAITQIIFIGLIIVIGWVIFASIKGNKKK